MNWFFKLLNLMALVTPEMRVAIKQHIDEMDARAKETKGDADNVAAGILKAVCVVLGLYR